MIVMSAKTVFHAPFVHSLKDKRAVVKSLIARVRAKFNVSAAETEEQDSHHTIVIGIACVSNTARHCESVLDSAIAFMEGATEAELIRVDREIL